MEWHVDASTFQEPLVQLAEVLAQKVKREAPKLLSGAPFVAADLHVLIRQAMHTYNLLFYLNADERRENDCYWRNAYSIVTLPLIRTMIDDLYNITMILQDPSQNGSWFRKIGFKKALAALDDDEQRYGGKPNWDRWIQKNRAGYDFMIRECGLSSLAVSQARPWPTLGIYVKNERSGPCPTPHQAFLKTFLYGDWRHYSAMAHGAFEGLLPVAMYYIPDSMPHDDRPKADAIFPKIFATHLARAAIVLLCIVTELQAHFHFDDDGARINQRIHAMWNALMPAYDAKELYEERYKQLMKDKRINP